MDEKVRLRASISLSTVTYSTRTIGIIVASTIALGSIVFAVLISGPLPFRTATADAESTHELLVSYAAKDTDTDGLPDWQEALYGTDPNNPHSVNQAVTDGEAVAQGLVKPKFANATTTPVDAASVPGTAVEDNTVTGSFARTLFGQYLLQHQGKNPTPEEIATFVEQGVADFNATHAIPNSFNQGQVRVSGTGPDALMAYAASAEAVFAKNAAKTDKNEVEYLSDAILKNDPVAVAQLSKIGASYSATAKAYIAISAPKELAAPHLALANALAHVGSDITDMANISKDPLRGYVGLANYGNDGPALLTALTALDGVYKSEQVVIPVGTGGSHFVATLNLATRADTTASPTPQ